MTSTPREGSSASTSTYPAGLAAGALFHSADKAELLVTSGSPDELAQAEDIIGLVLDCQERRVGAAHRGNFMWTHGDPVVTDKNAVEFILKHFIPMMIRYEERLAPATRTRVREAIRLGLEEIRAKDVAITYTNIAAMDCMNSCLGGEFLGDIEAAERGYEKLRRLAELTAANGTVFEFSSPTYMVVTLEALHRLATHVKHHETRIRARAMAARLGLSMALHMHGVTGRYGGPHSRAYLENVVCSCAPEVTVLRRLMGEGAAPDWLSHVLDIPVEPTQIVETGGSRLVYRKHRVPDPRVQHGHCVP